MPIATLVTVTVAPGTTALLLSRTVPVIVPRESCATAAPAVAATRAHAHATSVPLSDSLQAFHSCSSSNVHHLLCSRLGGDVGQRAARFVRPCVLRWISQTIWRSTLAEERRHSGRLSRRNHALGASRGKPLDNAMLCYIKRRMATNRHDSYLVKSLVHASEILWAFQHPGRGAAAARRDGAHRLRQGHVLPPALHAAPLRLHREGRQQPLPADVRDPAAARRYRIGYAAQGQDSSFAREVHDGLMRAAEREQVELIVVDNRYQPKIALKNAELLIRDGVDLVIEFQTDEAVAPAIAAKYREAEHPDDRHRHPASGRDLLRREQLRGGAARRAPPGAVGAAALERPRRRDPAARDRARGVAAGGARAGRAGGHPRGRCTKRPAWPVVSIDGDGQFKTALERVRKHLRESKAERILVGAANDPSALGAARAFQEAGRAADCAIVGQNAEPDARAELREPRTPLIASVGYFPEKYGDGLIRLALDILARRPVPAGGVRQAPDHHARERRPLLSERRAHGRRDLRAVLVDCGTSTTPRGAHVNHRDPQRNRSGAQSQKTY